MNNAFYQRLPYSLFALCLLLFSGLSQAAISPALYHVSKGQQSAYLFGSFHAGKQAYYPLPSAVQRALNDSDLLVAEVNLATLDPVQAATQIQAAGVYKDGSRLKDHIAPATYRELLRTAERYGLNAASLDLFRPWLVALTLTQLHYASIGMNAELGVDQYLVRQANQSDQQVMGLETFDQQLKLLLELDKDAEQTLRQTLEELNSSEDYAQALVSAWERGDGQRLAGIFEEISDGSKESSLFVDKLLVERNHNWIKQLTRLMQQQKPFVVVGSLHIEGPENLRQLLQAEGYSVTRVKY